MSKNSLPLRLEDLPNIGTKTAEALRNIGISSPADLEKIGVKEAYVRLRLKNPERDICACVLYSLYGALKGIPWNKIPEKKKIEFRDFSAELAREIPFSSKKKN